MSKEPLNNLALYKSNDFIMAKYKSSLLENQVMAIALTRIEENNTDPNNSHLEARLYPGELKKLISDETHIYRDLKRLAKTITGHTMFLEDGKGNFKAFSIVPNADYIDGVFIIKFNQELKNHILGLEKNYTTLELSVLTSFKKNNSYRLYEVLKKDAYKIPKTEGCFKVIHSVSELKLLMGLVNTDNQKIKNAIAANVGNWDELYNQLDENDKVYEEWSDFRKRIILPAQVELEEKSYIRFDFEGIREGRRIKKVEFTLYHNIPKNSEIIDEKKRFLDATTCPNRQLEIPLDIYPDLYSDYLGHNGLSKEDIDLLVKKANGNEDTIRKAIEMADLQPEIRNYMGWLVKCIENNYINISTIRGSHEHYDVIDDLQNSYNNERNIIIDNMWERYKLQPEFDTFLNEVLGGVPIQHIELAYSKDELTKMYADWHVRYNFS